MLSSKPILEDMWKNEAILKSPSLPERILQRGWNISSHTMLPAYDQGGEEPYRLKQSGNPMGFRPTARFRLSAPFFDAFRLSRPDDHHPG